MRASALCVWTWPRLLVLRGRPTPRAWSPPRPGYDGAVALSAGSDLSSLSTLLQPGALLRDACWAVLGKPSQVLPVYHSSQGTLFTAASQSGMLCLCPQNRDPSSQSLHSSYVRRGNNPFGGDCRIIIESAMGIRILQKCRLLQQQIARGPQPGQKAGKISCRAAGREQEFHRGGTVWSWRWVEVRREI